MTAKNSQYVQMYNVHCTYIVSHRILIYYYIHMQTHKHLHTYNVQTHEHLHTYNEIYNINDMKDAELEEHLEY